MKRTEAKLSSPISRSCVLLVIFIFSFRFLFAQGNLLNTNPPSIKWSKIQANNFSVYFDSRLINEGLYVAGLADHLVKPVSYSLGIYPRRIPIILQNQTVISNGFVSQIPPRAEFNVYPPQDYFLSGTLKWIDFLAVHELRHVIQFNKSIVGFNKLVYILFGYEASSVLSHLAIPDWFWEGDAVLTETTLTEGGRGRIPEFSRLMRTNLLERGPFNYYIQYLGSFRYRVPDHYVTGYYLTTYLRRHYGSGTVDKVLGKTWSWPFLPFRFSSVQKKLTGKTLIGNYRSMTREVDSLWTQQVESLPISEYKIINRRKTKVNTDYQYPQYLSNGNMIAVKSGLGDAAQFVEFDSLGNENRIFIPGIINENGNPKVGGNKIAWTEMEYDSRWSARDYSVIKIFDLRTRKLTRISRHSKFSSSGISPDGKSIVTLETSLDLKYNLVILDSDKGTIITTIDNPENNYYLTPSYSADGSKIVAIQKSAEGKAIWIYDPATQLSETIYGPVKENIGNPYLYSGYVFFDSQYSGIDNVYALNLANKKIYQITCSRYGAYNPVISSDGKHILYNEFSVNGMNIARIDLNPDLWRNRETVKVVAENYYNPVISQELTSNVYQQDSIKKYTVEPVDKSRGLLRPVAWGPYFTGTSLNLLLGINLQDILSTTLINAGYELNSNELTGRWVGDVSYQGLYPVINFTGYSGNRSVNEILQVQYQNTVRDTTVNIRWKEGGFKFGLEFPFNLTHSRYFENLDISVNTSLNNITDYNIPLHIFDQQGNGLLISNSYAIQYYRLLKISPRDINSRLGQTLYLQVDHTPFGGDYQARMLSAESRLFFPGIAKHHSFNLRFVYISQDLQRNRHSYWYPIPLFYVRGYSYIPFKQTLMYSANYLMPLVYPDIHLGPFLNIQRIYINLYVDHGTGYPSGRYSEETSVGFETFFDINLMRYRPLFNLGFRYYYLPELHQFGWKFLMGNFGL